MKSSSIKGPPSIASLDFDWPEKKGGRISSGVRNTLGISGALRRPCLSVALLTYVEVDIAMERPEVRTISVEQISLSYLSSLKVPR